MDLSFSTSTLAHLTKVSEYSQTVVYFVQWEQDNGFALLEITTPLPSGQESRAIHVLFFLHLQTLTSSKSEAPWSCRVRDWCRSCLAWLCFRFFWMMNESSELIFLFKGGLWNRLFLALLFLSHGLSLSAEFGFSLMARKPHSSLLTCAESVLHCGSALARAWAQHMFPWVSSLG